MDFSLGQLTILNVGAGDIKLSFDNDDPAEKKRAAKIVKEILRQGYALLVEVERGGEKAFERALDFREDTCEYVLATLKEVSELGKSGKIAADRDKDSGAAPRETGTKGRSGRRRQILPARRTRAVAVARSAGG